MAETQMPPMNPEFAAAWEPIKDHFPDLAGDIYTVRKHLADSKAALTATLPDVSADVKEEDTTVSARDGYAIPIRIYRPTSPPAAGSPLIVLLHGGGFVLGDIDTEAAFAKLFCKELGATVVNVDYRLAPEHPFPAAPNDSWDVTSWAAANASSLGADPSQGFIVGGTSAGGNLTDVVGHLARDNKLSPPLTGLLEMIPVVTAAERMPSKYAELYISRVQNAHAPILPVKTMEGFEAHYKADHSSTLYDTFNHPDGHAGLPPVYFVIAQLDPLRDDAVVYEKVLREEYGIPTRYKMYEGLPHGFWGFLPQLGVSQRLVAETVEGVKWLLTKPKESWKD